MFFIHLLDFTFSQTIIINHFFLVGLVSSPQAVPQDSKYFFLR